MIRLSGGAPDRRSRVLESPHEGEHHHPGMPTLLDWYRNQRKHVLYLSYYILVLVITKVEPTLNDVKIDALKKGTAIKRGQKYVALSWWLSRRRKEYSVL